MGKLLNSNAALDTARADYQRPLPVGITPTAVMVSDTTPGPTREIAALANRGLVKVDGKLLPVSVVHQAGWTQTGVPPDDGLDDGETLDGEVLPPLSAADQMKALTARTIEARTAERASSGLIDCGPAREAALAFTSPSRQVEAAAARGDISQAAGDIFGRVGRAGLDNLYSGPMPAELQFRQPYLGIASRGIREAIGNPATDPLAGAPAEPQRPKGANGIPR